MSTNSISGTQTLVTLAGHLLKGNHPSGGHDRYILEFMKWVASATRHLTWCWENLHEHGRGGQAVTH